jgi:hypothetical protein
MKEKVANYSKGLLVITVVFGLFLAWKESRSPFNYIKEKMVQTETLSSNIDHRAGNGKQVE